MSKRTAEVDEFPEESQKPCDDPNAATQDESGDGGDGGGDAPPPTAPGQGPGGN